MPKSTGSEQRQHLSLSQLADSVIREDAINYYGRLNDSGVINRIIRNYKDTGSIGNKIVAKREAYTHAIGASLSGKAKQDVIESLIEADIESWKQQSYPKDVTHKIRLQSDIWEELYDSGCWPESPYYSSQGEFIKALVEEYARKSSYDRERIFFKDTFDRIETALNREKTDKRILRFKYETASGQVITCHVKPYGLQSDPAFQFHYLVGLSQIEGSQEYTLASFRVSRIQDDTIVEHAKSYGSGSIPESMKKQIARKLESIGVQFLLSSEESVKVHLTAAGVQMYQTQYYLRPAYSCVRSIERFDDGSAIYEFSCTNRQIEYYFFRFGKEARIISPEQLARRFQQQYKEAFLSYPE